MQEAIVLILFFAIIAWAFYRFFIKPSGEGCSTCSFNEGTQAD
jgi:hypothetical protein